MKGPFRFGIRGESLALIALSAVALGAVSALGAGEKVWVEEAKYVVLEAEAVDGGYEQTHWELRKQPPGWSGSGYLVWNGSPLTGEGMETVGYDEVEDSRKLVYRVLIKHPGVYCIKVRNYHAGSGRGIHPFDGDNDCFVSMKQGEFGKQYDFNRNAFTWCETGVWRKAHLEAGVHEIAIAGRSPGFGLDRIVLFHEDLSPDADFEQLPESWVEAYSWAGAPESKTTLKR